MKKHFLILMCLACLAFSACEKAVFDDNNEEKPPKPDNWKGVELTFNIAKFEQTDFSSLPMGSRAASVGEVCDRINLAIYQDGTRVTNVNQKAGDSNFGQISLTLSPGNYELVVLAHSCDGNATTTNLNKLTFPSNKVTDTFYYYTTLNVSDKQEHDLTLRRAVAMVRFKINDAMPDNVKRMKFYYTGGSSTFDAATGYGCVNSKQTEYRDVTAAMTAQPTQFEVYTLPHAENGELKMTVQALDAADNVVKELTLDKIPITRNKITEYSGNFFGTQSGGEGGGESKSNTHEFAFEVDNEWSSTESHGY